MKTNHECHKAEIKNLDDIVFEERNKNYGAYFLRSNYNKNVASALFIAVLLFLGAISIPLIAGFIHTKYKLAGNGKYEMDSTLFPPPVKPDLPDIPKKIIEEKIPAYTAPIIVNDSTDVNEELASLMEGSKDEEISESDGDGVLVIDIDKNINKAPIEFDVGETVLIPDVYPSFIGGEDAMYKWLGSNII